MQLKLVCIGLASSVSHSDWPDLPTGSALKVVIVFIRRGGLALGDISASATGISASKPASFLIQTQRQFKRQQGISQDSLVRRANEPD